ncbi:type 2 lanthipeptide synthetase LanM family protein [Metabacillus sp. FJAT-52054]|uniref:Type 2 lanthipeptide synthetase LanM family protein n=1 Tax=Metabacillus sediminis TaxID=3117746 RepID=A0ABZ2NGZ0_9BACI
MKTIITPEQRFAEKIIHQTYENTPYANHFNETGLFDDFYTPFIRSFEQDLSALLHSIPSIDLAINFEKIMIRCLISLKEELINLSIKTLITDLYEKKKSGQIQGETKEERYHDYHRSLQTKDVFIELFNKYPVLIYLIEGKMKTKLQLISDVLNRLLADLLPVQSMLGVSQMLLEDIQFSMGDSHNNGQTVLILTISGRKIVYKPHTLSPEKSFYTLLNWVQSKGELRVPLKGANIISCGEYGWQEFIPYQECRSTEEVTDYYYRIGVLLALFKILKCSDIHYENIISNGEYPVVIDLETLLTHEPQGEKSGELMTAFFEELDRSVLGTLLLPQNLEQSPIDFDVSGLLGHGGETSDRVITYQLINPGTDEIRFTPDFFVSESNQNITRLNGETVRAADYLNSMEQGFTDGYQTVEKHKDELIRRIEMFNGTYRQVLRATHIYGRFLEAAGHPGYMRSIEDRKALFSYLREHETEETAAKNLAEIESLMRNDVPYFTAEFSGLHLHAGREICARNYYEYSLKDLLVKRIAEVSMMDRKKQISYIRMSVLSKLDKNWGGRHQENQAEMVNEEKLLHLPASPLDAAIQLGDLLLEHAIWNSKRTSCTWLSPNLGREDKLHLGPINDSLYEGAGAVLFLAALSEETGDARYRILARGALGGLEELWPLKEEGRTHSVYSGLGSLLYLSYNLSVLWNDQKLYEQYRTYVKMLSDIKLNSETELDWIGGLSGLIVCLLNMYEQEKEEELLVLACRMGEHLFLETRKKTDYLTGFSHGLAGYAYALSFLGKAAGEEKYSEAAKELVAKENSYFRDETGNWRDLRTPEEDQDLVFWCHGAAGIGLARAKMAVLAARTDEELIRDAERALEKVVKDGFEEDSNHSLCHGIFGNLDILLEAAGILGDQELLESARRLGDRHLFTLSEEGFRYGLNPSGGLMGFMLGFSGIGYSLLRLQNPVYPSVLSLDVMPYRGVGNEIGHSS